jgi:molecular chaperone GrpE
MSELRDTPGAAHGAGEEQSSERPRAHADARAAAATTGAGQHEGEQRGREHGGGEQGGGEERGGEERGGEERGGERPESSSEEVPRAYARAQHEGDGARDATSGDAGGAPEPEQATADGNAADIEGDIDELVKMTAQRDEYLSLAQRTQADFENYKKRVAREAKQAVERGVVKLAKELLPALDNLDRAIGAAASEDPLLEGVRLVRSEISAALARVGVESFSPAGETFDPAVHEAVATVEQPEDGAASGTVAEVYEPGYRLGETIIRPARVVVAA